MIDAIGKQIAAVTSAEKSISPERDAQIRERAIEFEATFVSQMLKYSGLTESLAKQAGSGGDAFTSFLIDEYANEIVDQGGFGLADKIYDQLKERDGNNGAK